MIPILQRSRRTVRSLVIACAALFPLVAVACPLCNTETGKQVRDGIFGNDFWTTPLIVASPFPILLLATAAYHFDWLKVAHRLESGHTPTAAPNNPTAP